MFRDDLTGESLDTKEVRKAMKLGDRMLQADGRLRRSSGARSEAWRPPGVGRPMGGREGGRHPPIQACCDTNQDAQRAGAVRSDATR